jgi:thiosulfate dehydrogenase [quinone] large subunit
MTYSKPQLFFLMALRLFAGWHFLFEGLIKLLTPGWTAQGYLMSATGPFAPLFNWLGRDSLIPFSDTLTAIALSIVGLTLILGVWEKAGAFIGIGMLTFFYLAHPSWPGIPAAGPAEGNYFIVNKNLVELAALGVLAYFPTGHLMGLEIFFKKQSGVPAQNNAHG